MEMFGIRFLSEAVSPSGKNFGFLKRSEGVGFVQAGSPTKANNSAVSQGDCWHRLASADPVTFPLSLIHRAAPRENFPVHSMTWPRYGCLGARGLFTHGRKW